MGSVRDIAPDWLTFYRASDWGIKWKRPPVAEKQEDPETYIHHGAGGRFGLDPIAAMLALQEWFHEYKNYSTIGYDIMVHRNTMDNTVAICGARENWLSAATLDRNDLGEAICLMGYFHPGHALSEHPTDREIEALAFAVAWSIEHRWSARDTKVLGHRDNPAHPGATGCPGDYLYPHVPYIGRRAIELLTIANEQGDDIMQTLKTPIRVFDSRTAGVPLMPGESRGVDLGSTLTTEAVVNVTAVSVNGAGHVSVNDPQGATSVVNYSKSDHVDSNAVPVVASGGKIIVTNHVGIAHVIVDVFAKKP